MTRARIYGSDTPFCDWLRKCKELPSYSFDCGVVAADNDVTIHRYLSCVDSVGTREVQAIMQVEVKTRSGLPTESQLDTLSKLNLFRGSRVDKGTHIRFFGVFLLVLSGTSPDDSKDIWWCGIPEGKVIKSASALRWRSITKPQLISILKFDLHPVNLESNPFRRHHKTSEVVQIEQTPLGFECERVLIKRS
jgi:hypothetical protein